MKLCIFSLTQLKGILPIWDT